MCCCCCLRKNICLQCASGQEDQINLFDLPTCMSVKPYFGGTFCHVCPNVLLLLLLQKHLLAMRIVRSRFCNMGRRQSMQAILWRKLQAQFILTTGNCRKSKLSIDVCLHLLRVVGLKAIVENVKLTLLGLFRIHVAHFACFGLFSIQDHAQCLHCTLHKSAWFGLFAKKTECKKPR